MTAPNHTRSYRLLHCEKRWIYLGYIIPFERFFLGVFFCLLGMRAATQTTDTTIKASDTARVIISNDNNYNTTITRPVRSGKTFYDFIKPDNEGLKPLILYSSDDRLYTGLNYNLRSPKWRPDSLGAKHKVYTHYSFNQAAFSLGYQGIYNRVFGNWNLFVDAGYDWIKWINFYGLGNETLEETDNRDYYRIRSREGVVNLSLQRRVGKQGNFTLTPFFQHIQFINDRDRFLSKTTGLNTAATYAGENFGGAAASVLLQKLNNLLVPTKGIVFSAGISQTWNLAKPRSFANYSVYNRIYLPVLRHFILSVENGAAAVTGEPEFYQLNSIGGSRLRGHRRERFWGETVYHNNNELHYLFNAPWKPIKGKLGVLGFFDQGRVWKQGERSSRWHHGYGGGVILVPHNKIYLSAQYGISNERRGFHFTFRRAL